MWGVLLTRLALPKKELEFQLFPTIHIAVQVELKCSINRIMSTSTYLFANLIIIIIVIRAEKGAFAEEFAPNWVKRVPAFFWQGCPRANDF